MAAKRMTPRQGWVYMIDASTVLATCRGGHFQFAHLDVGEADCVRADCTQKVNLSHVQRGPRPYVVWSHSDLLDGQKMYNTITAIPLTSKSTYNGLPTTYPINKSTKNGLTERSHAIITQITAIDHRAFKEQENSKDVWRHRVGQLDKDDKEAIAARIAYLFGVDETPSPDWFKQHASIDLIEQVFDNLPADQRSVAIERLIEKLDNA